MSTLACRLQHASADKDGADGASPARTEAAMKMTRPPRKARLRPSRSPNLPARRSSGRLKVMLYAVNTHESSACEACRNEREMPGKATLTIVTSIATRSQNRRNEKRLPRPRLDLAGAVRGAPHSASLGIVPEGAKPSRLWTWPITPSSRQPRTAPCWPSTYSRAQNAPRWWAATATL